MKMIRQYLKKVRQKKKIRNNKRYKKNGIKDK